MMQIELENLRMFVETIVLAGVVTGILPMAMFWLVAGKTVPRNVMAVAGIIACVFVSCIIEAMR